MHNISTGIFTKSDPSYPVSWMTYSDTGHMMGLRTLLEYQRKSFGLAVTAHISAQGQKQELSQSESNLQTMSLHMLGIMLLTA